MLDADAGSAGDVVAFARENGVTQLFLAHPKPRGLKDLLRAGIEEQVIALSPDMQVTIVANRARA